ncbi:Manganese-dependent adp-ribose cdp-alcohol diphosphatase-like, partial [Globisporangium splendens]
MTAFPSTDAAPLVSFGLLSDVQYADVDDGWNFHRTSQRFYRNALQLLQDAVAEWMRVSSSSTLTPLSFAVNLGDLIDGKNRMVGTSQMALDRAKAAWVPFQESVGPVHHLVGNHELYNLTPEELHKQLLWWKMTANAAADPPASYYDFVSDKAPKFRFVVLNCYGISSLGRTKDDPVAMEAYKILRAMNPNANLNSPEGLAGNDARFVEYNGGIDDEQVAWLKGVLKDAQLANEHVVVFTHIPLHPQSTYPSSLLWNYQELLDLIYDAKCVRVVFSGHSHDDGYVFENGVHFVVCDAILECAPDTNAHAIVHVHEDKLVMQGYGKIPTRELVFPAAALS